MLSNKVLDSLILIVSHPPSVLYYYKSRVVNVVLCSEELNNGTM